MIQENSICFANAMGKGGHRDKACLSGNGRSCQHSQQLPKVPNARTKKS